MGDLHRRYACRHRPATTCRVRESSKNVYSTAVRSPSASLPKARDACISLICLPSHSYFSGQRANCGEDISSSQDPGVEGIDDFAQHCFVMYLLNGPWACCLQTACCSESPRLFFPRLRWPRCAVFNESMGYPQSRINIDGRRGLSSADISWWRNTIISLCFAISGAERDKR
ncbi:uncharacterized protein BP01DRAFT_356095 [Aspergillus saccharolyticus JOP 1030-1]|uniref:Uncharacterized protein n=1 Tax=Aspergillus saccharolyticus JOP 1030-1 TaxID=1450539 RepID=A0A318ZEP4_9EURO|nr:hypothetical protein BP01DRAFT_356095 [Aspergillus saccharolyticus JOP 1030-1]PYH45889.1 hypothetical protein BP01DRAFT_356095 [Aspergillus saccharolyticus JOP 1030-1]